MINNNVADEREDVQKKTFAKWINSQLLKVKELVRSNYRSSVIIHTPFIRGTVSHARYSRSFTLKSLHAWNVIRISLLRVFILLRYLLTRYNSWSRDASSEEKTRDGRLICLIFRRIIMSRSAICSSTYGMEIACCHSWKCSLLRLM